MFSQIKAPAGLLWQGWAVQFPGAGVFTDALGFTSRPPHSSLEGPRPRGKRSFIFLLAHLKCVWPFQRIRAPGSSRKKLFCLGPGWAGGQGAVGLVLASGAGAHSGPPISPSGQGSVSYRRRWHDPFQGWLGYWAGAQGGNLVWVLALMLPVLTPLPCPAHGCPAVFPSKPWDQG